MHIAEKHFTKCNGSRHIKENLRQKYIYNRICFDKSLSKAERAYKKAT